MKRQKRLCSISVFEGRFRGLKVNEDTLSMQLCKYEGTS